jgi:transcriptional regulator with XRE-family HTH domain
MKTIKKIRVSTGKTSGEMASAIGVSPSVWSMVENNRRHQRAVKMFVRLARVYKEQTGKVLDFSQINIDHLEESDGAKVV